MTLLFLTMSSGMRTIDESGIYTDLMRKFRDEGWEVYIVYPNERRLGRSTEFHNDEHVHFWGVRTLNLTKTNVVEKGIGQLLLEWQFNAAIRKYFKGIKFDLILYSTPPITFNRVIKAAKANANPEVISYMILKDIFPQNAVDLGMMSMSGLKGILYRMFRRKEMELYRISDFIGCMSPANVRYVLEHNPEVSASKVEIAPNSYDEPKEYVSSDSECRNIREKFNLSTDKTIFIYGSNMGKPQGIPFLVECLRVVKDRIDCHFVVVEQGNIFGLADAIKNMKVAPLSAKDCRRRAEMYFDKNKCYERYVELYDDLHRQ